MKKTATFALFILATALVHAKEATPSLPSQPWRFFAAMSMTKTQINSPTPEISGAFLRQPNGRWLHFGGDQIKWVNALAVSPANPAVVYLGCGNGILRSRDDGRTWRLTTDWHVADVFTIQGNPVDSSRVYAATGWGIWRSMDSGETWIESDRGLPLTGKFTQTLVVDSSQPSRLIAGTDVGMYISNDGADSWSPVVGASRAPILHLEQAAGDPQHWIVGTQGEGVQLSTDGGATWTVVAPALARSNVYAASIDPSDSSRIAAAGWSQGIQVSRDGGKTWRDATRGLPSTHVSAIAFDRNTRGRLWASTFEEGTFYSDDLGRTWHSGGLYGAYVLDLKFVPRL